MKIYAHRGFSGRYPEGSLLAYRGAIDIGADGMECDVRLTKDDELICFHDATTERLLGKAGRISKLTLEEINKMSPVLRFEELLELAITNKKDLLVETKHPVIKGGKVESKVIDQLEKNHDRIKSSGIRVILMSFSYLAILRARRRYSEVGYVVKKRWRLNFLPSKIVAVGFFLIKAYPKIINKLENHELLVWTVNEKSDLREAKELGLHNIITNFPDRAQEAFKS